MADSREYPYQSIGEQVVRKPVPGNDIPEFVGSMANPFLANKVAYLLNEGAI